jgi:hypothetical protein
MLIVPSLLTEALGDGEMPEDLRAMVLLELFGHLDVSICSTFIGNKSKLNYFPQLPVVKELLHLL